ncbi:energy transducer TonB [Capnocytophaga canimorsus]|uniref:energy transducer TonB n=1 Tax=Capnocytophaga canimorsus TaxID=28188 RepID=UPI0037D5A2A4
MKPKKNPHADLTKNSGLFFALGLALVSGLTWGAIEMKSKDDDKKFNHVMDVDKNLDEELDAIVMPNTPPPPPPPPPATPPPTIEVVEDNKDIKDEVIASNETSKEEKIVEVEHIETVEEEIPVDVPFTLIEDKPMFEACKGVSKDKQFDCFKQNLDNHVKKNFRYPEMAQEMGIQGRVNVQFRINTDGTITILAVRGPDKSLEAEARRIIEKLPKLIPGKQRNKPTPVTFAYPITFRLAN